MTSTDIDTRCMVLHTRNRTGEAHKARHDHMREEQRRVRIAEIVKTNADASEFQDETWMRQLFAAGAFCGIVGLSFAVTYFILVGVFCI